MASPSEGQSSDALVHSTHHEQLDAMVELAQICHFCGTFQAPLKLPAFSRTDLQAALIAGATGDDREVALLAEVHFKLVREQGAKLERMIQDWERAVARKVTDNWHLEFSSNPFDGAAYDDLTVAQRIQVLNALCHWKLESCAEIQKFLSTFQKETDPKALEALRATPIGYDDAGAAYWYFGDCCWVYAEDRPVWQTERCQKYAVEFADAKRIRLSINFDPTRTAAVPLLVGSVTAGDKPLSPSLTNGEGEPAAQSTATETSTRDKMQITALMDEQIEEDEDEDEPLPITKTEEAQEEPEDADVKPPVAATTPPPPPPDEASQSRKMDITMLCGSPEAADTPPKAEQMEEDERDISEDRFMSTIVSKRDPVKTETVMNGEQKVPERDLKVEPEPVDNGKRAGEKQDDVVEMKKRRLSEERVDVKQDDSKQPEKNELPAPPKRRKTRFHDIIRVSDNTSQSLGDKVISLTTLKVDTSQTPPTEESKKEPPVAVEPPAKEEDEDFDIMCAACQRSYDRRYLDPPLENRPAGEWRCFECLVNDARGWPRRRNPTSRSPKGSMEATEEVDEASHRKKSPLSSSKRSKSKSSSSKSSSSKKKSSSSRSSSSSSSKKKTSSSSSSSKKSSKKKSKKSSSSSSKHHSSSSHHHHHNRHREGFAKLLTLAQGRKRERLVMEEARLHGAYLHPVSLDGPTGWRVVCCSVEGLRQVIEKLAGGSLEQDRLRGRLILILKVEEKMEAERLKKREQQLWQILPRRQSSRVAMGRIKNQHSGESASETDGDEKDEGGAGSDHQRQRSARLRGATNGHTSRDRLARDRESRAKRRRLEDGSESDSESDQGAGLQARSVVGWINWSRVKGDTSLALVCSGVIDRLLKEDISELFARPVDPEEDGCPDYLTVIQQPMDLGTIRTRVTSGYYTTWELFKMDVDRVWKNCRQYNSPDTVVVEYADALDEMFKQMRKEAERHGVRKMGKLDVNDGGSKSADEDDDEDELHDSSDDNSSMKDGKAKSDSSASEVSSEESDDSSDAGSGDDDDADETSGSKRKTRNRSSGAKATSRVSRSSTARPSRASRSPAASSTKTRPSRSRKVKKDSDSEEEDDDNSGDSDEDEEPDLDSDDSEKGNRSRSSRSRQPRRGAQSSKRASPRRSAPRGAPPPAEDAAKPKPPSSRRNHIDESSESSSFDGSVKGDDSSSSSDSDEAAEDQGEPPAPAPAQPPSVPDAEHDASASALAPPPPSTPPPPPPPLSANNTPPSNSSSGRKPKRPAASSSGGRSRASPTSLLNEFPQSPASSSSYFSSSESESSAGGSDSSDSD